MNTILVIVFATIVIDGQVWKDVWYKDMGTQEKCEKMVEQIKKARPLLPVYCTDKPPSLLKIKRG